MLPRSQRLSVEQFNAVMDKGRVVHSSLFLLRFIKNTPTVRTDRSGQIKSNGPTAPTNRVRISAVAPQKVAKKAVQRNKLRRQIYEAIQTLYASINPDVNAIVFAKDAAVSADFTAISQDIKTLFVKAGLMK